MELPPGVTLVTASARSILLPPAIALCGISFWQTQYNVSMPIWLQLPLCAASLPLTLACSVVYADFRERRQATANGAILAPRVPSKWPGGLDLLFATMQNFRSGYLGMYDLPISGLTGCSPSHRGDIRTAL